VNYEAGDLGSIEISDAVIRDLAVHSYMEFIKTTFKDQRAKREAKSAVEIEVIERDPAGKVVRIDVNTKVKYGEPIPDFARKMQEKLKNDVETYSGLKVEEVSVTVEDVYDYVEEIAQEQEEGAGEEDNGTEEAEDESAENSGEEEKEKE